MELAAMTDSDYYDFFSVIINDVANSPITNANAPHAFLTLHFYAFRTARITPERHYWRL